MIHEFKHISSKLCSIYTEQEAQSITYILFEDLLGIKKTDIFASAKNSLASDEKQIIENALKDLLNHFPVQHIIGFADFMGLKFKVNKDVLIPRQETEELVMLCLKHADYRGLKVLDIGTGSGCIPIALKKENPLLDIVSVDISETALDIARENAIANQVKVDFMQLDILNQSLWNKLAGSFDMIISNPPYVSLTDKKLMKKNVIDHEPEIALFVPEDDALIFYRSIAKLAKIFLVDEGMIFLEINENLGEETKLLFENEGFQDVRIIKDFHEKDRILVVRE